MFSMADRGDSGVKEFIFKKTWLHGEVENPEESENYKEYRKEW